MKKRKSRAFGKEVFLLGMDRTGTMYWLEAPSWDCNWYWGFGYIETYTDNENPAKSADISSHEHFKDLRFIGNRRVNLYEGFRDKFPATPLTDGEIFKLCELMQSFYTCRDYSDFLHRYGSNYTSNPCGEIIKNPDEYDRINKLVLPAIFQNVMDLLDPETEES